MKLIWFMNHGNFTTKYGIHNIFIQNLLSVLYLRGSTYLSPIEWMFIVSK